MQNFFIVLGLIFALLYLPINAKRSSVYRSLIKTLPVILFSLAGWFSGVGAYLVAGLFLSALGDFGLSRDGDRGFLYGLAAFALAHIVYVLHFLNLSDAGLIDAFIDAPILSILLISLMISTELWLAPFTGSIAWPVRVYVLLIGLMGLSALTHVFGLQMFGAGAFILSDLLLALVLFRLPDGSVKKISGYLVWITYIAAQLFLLLGAMFELA